MLLTSIRVLNPVWEDSARFSEGQELYQAETQYKESALAIDERDHQSEMVLRADCSTS